MHNFYEIYSNDIRRESKLVKNLTHRSRTIPLCVAKRLAHSNLFVRRKLAACANFMSILQQLKTDNNWHVRFCVTYNPHTPKTILRQLCGDKDIHVRQMARLQIKKRQV